MARGPKQRKGGSTGTHFFTEHVQRLEDQGMEGMGRYYSWYRAFVYDVDDPDNLNRLQLIIPDLTGKQPLEIWAYPVGVYSGVTKSGKPYGIHMLPQEGDMVWAGFEAGNPQAPIWKFGHWGLDEKKPEDADYTGPNSFWFKTPQGHTLLINDTKNTINVIHSNGQNLELDEDGVSIISGKKISLGQQHTSDEPAVLGDKLETILTGLLDDLGLLSGIQTSSGITGLLNTAPTWQVFRDKWVNQFKDFKSKKVTLDK